MKKYIVYVDGQAADMIRASGHNAAEKKAKAMYPGKQVMVEYIEI